MRILVVGSGGREHALVWKLHQSPETAAIFVAPGNAGTGTPTGPNQAVARNADVAATDLHGLLDLVEDRGIDLTVVGPEVPLALGLADLLRARGHLVFGPGSTGARIEASKSFAKGLMRKAGVPTARYRVFDGAQEARTYLATARYPLVVKADALAAGKGVTVCGDREEAEATLQAFMVDRIHGAVGERVVVEEALAGPEVSLLALVAGEAIVPLPVAQDHKRLGNGDSGPNTGGMGAYAPVAWMDTDERERLVDLVMRPVVEAMARAGIDYRGVLYAGLMLTQDGPRVLEYNCRFGDPETQVILPLLAGDLLPWLTAVAEGDLKSAPSTIGVTGQSAVGVVLAAPGYPEAPRTGDVVEGLDSLPEDVLVFHAGTARPGDGRVVSSGGRVLTVVGRGASPAEARQRAYSAPVHLPGARIRTDIARPREPRRARVGVLASGDGSNLQALLDACRAGEIEADVAVLISGRRQARALDRARAGQVPALSLPLTGRGDPTARAAYERRLLDHLRPFELDLLVLAGWMQILSADFLRNCGFPVINVHPALLSGDGEDELQIDGRTVPVLRGMGAVRQALDRRLPFTGVTVHHVTAQVDAGPVVLRQRVDIEAGDSEESLYSRIKTVEHRLLVDAVRVLLAPSQPSHAGSGSNPPAAEELQPVSAKHSGRATYVA